MIISVMATNSRKEISRTSFDGLLQEIRTEQISPEGKLADQQAVNLVAAWQQLALAEIKDSFGVDQVSMRAMTTIVKRQPAFPWVSQAWKSSANPQLLEQTSARVAVEIVENKGNLFGVDKKQSFLEPMAKREARVNDFVQRACALALVEDELAQKRKDGIIPEPDAVQDLIAQLTSAKTASAPMSPPSPVQPETVPTPSVQPEPRPANLSALSLARIAETEALVDERQPWFRVTEKLVPILNMTTSEDECPPVIAAMLVILARGISDPAEMRLLRDQYIREYQQDATHNGISFVGDKLTPLYAEGLTLRIDQVKGMYTAAESAEELSWSSSMMSTVARSDSPFAAAASKYTGPVTEDMHTPVKAIANPGYRRAEVVQNLNPQVSEIKPGETVSTGYHDNKGLEQRMSLLVGYDGTSRYILDPVTAVIAKIPADQIEADDYISLRGTVDAGR